MEDKLDIRTLADWKPHLRAEAVETVLNGRWGLAIIVAGWAHLAVFLGCQAISDPSIKSDMRHLGLWVVDVLALVGIMRGFAGKGWYRINPAASLIVRIWATFLILAFNLATLNALSGWDHDWFKPIWGTLSTFGFATMAWLFTPRFLIPAVQMSLTGMAMVRFPGWNFGIYAVSWWLVTQYVGFSLHLQSRRAPAPPVKESRDP